MRLQGIGFYTLSNKRAKTSSLTSNMQRCEIILTHKCNFHCPYCRGLRKDCKGDMFLSQVKEIIDMWAKDNLQNIRFSGGEPSIYPHLESVVEYAKKKNIKRIAVSTNGSADFNYYKNLINKGVNDFSISLDACCSLMGKKMIGNSEEMWDKVVDNIRRLSQIIYVTVGMVFTPDNISQAKESIEFAHSLDVADIRILSSAQFNQAIQGLDSLNDKLLNAHPILKYRVMNFRQGRNVGGLKQTDYDYCPLVLDDSAVAGKWHFPCIIYMREHGNPIGEIGTQMRQERLLWFAKHNTYEDPICKENCLDVCIDYNNKWKEYKKRRING